MTVFLFLFDVGIRLFSKQYIIESLYIVFPVLILGRQLFSFLVSPPDDIQHRIVEVDRRAVPDAQQQFHYAVHALSVASDHERQSLGLQHSLHLSHHLQ